MAAASLPDTIQAIAPLDRTIGLTGQSGWQRENAGCGSPTGTGDMGITIRSHGTDQERIATQIPYFLTNPRSQARLASWKKAVRSNLGLNAQAVMLNVDNVEDNSLLFSPAQRG